MMKKILLGIVCASTLFGRVGGTLATPVLTSPPPSALPVSPAQASAMVEAYLKTVFEPAPPPMKFFLILPAAGFVAGAGTGYVYRLVSQDIRDRIAQSHQKQFFKRLNNPKLIEAANRLCKPGEPCMIRYLPNGEFIAGFDDPDPMYEQRERDFADLLHQRRRYEQEQYENLKALGLVSSDFLSWQKLDSKTKKDLWGKALLISLYNDVKKMGDGPLLWRQVYTEPKQAGVLDTVSVKYAVWFMEIQAYALELKSMYHTYRAAGETRLPIEEFIRLVNGILVSLETPEAQIYETEVRIQLSQNRVGSELELKIESHLENLKALRRTAKELLKNLKEQASLQQ